MTSADFEQAREFLMRGGLQAEAMVLRMQDLRVSEAEYAAWRAQRKARGQPGSLGVREVRRQQIDPARGALGCVVQPARTVVPIWPRRSTM